jgi:hypothetical protein
MDTFRQALHVEIETIDSQIDSVQDRMKSYVTDCQSHILRTAQLLLFDHQLHAFKGRKDGLLLALNLYDDLRGSHEATNTSTP